MNVLLTGASGFLGAFVLRALLADSVTVGCILRNPARSWRIRDCLDQTRVFVGDLNDAAFVDTTLRHFEPQAVIHCAWEGVGNKERNNHVLQYGNVMSAMQLAEASHRVGCETWIGIGSQAEYGPQATRITEQALPHPTTFYGAAKVATQALVEQYCLQRQMRFAWLRVFSLYGPQEDPNWLITYLMTTLLNRGRPALTKGEQAWDYLYGADAAAAVVAVLHAAEACGTYNLASGKTVILREMITRIRDMISPTLELGFGEVAYRPDQVMHLEGDIARLQADTHWQPQTSLEDGLRLTLEWVKSKHDQAGSSA